MPSESYFDEESVSDSQRLLSTYSQSTEDYETDEKYLIKEKSLRKKVRWKDCCVKRYKQRDRALIGPVLDFY